MTPSRRRPTKRLKYSDGHRAVHKGLYSCGMTSGRRPGSRPVLGEVRPGLCSLCVLSFLTGVGGWDICALRQDGRSL